MVRVLSLMAMTGGFLAISPKLRDSVLGGYTQAGVTIDANSPFSYIALGVAVVGVLMIFLYKSSQPRGHR
jgi:hypothetical protein